MIIGSLLSALPAKGIHLGQEDLHTADIDTIHRQGCIWV